MIRITSDLKFGFNRSKLRLICIGSDWFRFIQNFVSDWIELSWIYFWPFFIKRDTKSFFWIGSEWFGNRFRNSSDSFGMNFNPILSPGMFRIGFWSIGLDARFENDQQLFSVRLRIHSNRRSERRELNVRSELDYDSGRLNVWIDKDSKFYQVKSLFWI